jgi:hypothetical protein
MVKLDDFTRAFFECALWSSTDNSRDDGGDPLDDNYSIDDIAPVCLAALVAECARFQAENAKRLTACDGRVTRVSDSSHAAMAGHDFWLNRCGHGAGFWDGDWPEPYATQLSDASKVYGNVDLYVGDDKQIWASGYENGERFALAKESTL